MRRAVLEDVNKECLKAVASYEYEISTQVLTVPLIRLLTLPFCIGALRQSRLSSTS
jgi:hypothetical protein